MANFIEVSLVDYTGALSPNAAHYAAAVLAFTKNTRLEMSPMGLAKQLERSYDDLLGELSYMANTIPSSWEFVDLTFSIQNVTRACAQQITRTRWSPVESDMFGSYAMQSQRVTDVSAMGFRIPPNSGSLIGSKIDLASQKIMATYATLIREGAEPEDARSILPMNIQCNLLAKYNLRTFVEIVKARQSLRAQDEFQEVAKLMLEAVRGVYPWVDMFLINKQDAAIKIIEDVAIKLPTEDKRALAKAADLIRKG